MGPEWRMITERNQTIRIRMNSIGKKNKSKKEIKKKTKLIKDWIINKIKREREREKGKKS